MQTNERIKCIMSEIIDINKSIEDMRTTRDALSNLGEDTSEIERNIRWHEQQQDELHELFLRLRRELKEQQ